MESKPQMTYLAGSQARAVAVLTLVLRIVTLGAVAASLVVLVTAPRIDFYKYMSFQHLYTYKYVLSMAAIGCAYTLILIPLAIIDIVQGRSVGGSSPARVLIFTDVVFCTLFATGGAAGLGVIVDYQRRYRGLFNSAHKKFNTFFDSSCGLLVVAAFCTLVIIMVSVCLK